MTARGDHGACAKHLGRPKNCADIVGVRHPIKQDHARSLARRGGTQIDQLAPIQRANLQRRALMHGSRVQRGGKLAGIGNFRLQTTRCKHLRPQPVSRIARQHKAQLFASGIGQCIAHGVQPEEPHRLAGLCGLCPFLIDHPAGFFHGASPCAALLPCSRRYNSKKRLLTGPNPDAAQEFSASEISGLTPPACLYIRRLTPEQQRCNGRGLGDRPQGVAGDCNSLEATHAWFDSRVAHHHFLSCRLCECGGPCMRRTRIWPCPEHLGDV